MTDKFVESKPEVSKPVSQEMISRHVDMQPLEVLDAAMRQHLLLAAISAPRNRTEDYDGDWWTEQAKRRTYADQLDRAAEFAAKILAVKQPKEKAKCCGCVKSEFICGAIDAQLRRIP